MQLHYIASYTNRMADEDTVEVRVNQRESMDINTQERKEEEATKMKKEKKRERRRQQRHNKVQY